IILLFSVSITHGRYFLQTMIRGLTRSLQYRIGFSERFVRNHWSIPSSPETPGPSGVKATEKREEPHDSYFAESFKKLLPSQQFRDGLSKSEKRRLELLIKQTEMYCSMSWNVPKTIADKEWN
ncbi:hypothetical protein PMAYCL1PPCAC_14398, partial [Pristionchus mayeri]